MSQGDLRMCLEKLPHKAGTEPAKHNSVWIIKERRLKITDWPHHRERQQFCPWLFYLVLCFILRRIMWNKSFSKLSCFLVSRSAYTLGQTCINSQKLQLLANGTKSMIFLFAKHLNSSLSTLEFCNGKVSTYIVC